MFSSFILATPEQDAEVKFFEILTNCMKEYALTEDDINKLKDLALPTGANSPCYMACVMKQFGVMDDSGMVRANIDAEKAKPLVKDPEGLNKLDGYLETCSYVNNESVSDGEKGCDRAVLFYKCMMENDIKIFQF
ncbi:unnamed protein product [Arctia plantaginis]|uniref:Uncharacterized protein n=1 Tax=Arctia plantaginis TaxID=874455 RepID=A0A8S1AGV7_ARCPL|nr:unnamed protein product [Arctia plantaginis]CAB3255590.1 unnamed protein product [Arctia plantaginis]